MRTRRWLLAALFNAATLFLAVASALTAHDLYRSESRLEVHGREVHAAFTFNLLDFPGVDQDHNKSVTPQEFDAAFDGVYAAILQHYALDSSGPPSMITRNRDRLFDDHVLDLDLTYTFPQDVLGLKVRSSLPEILGKDHIHLVTFILNGRLQEGVLAGSHPEAFFTQTSGSKLQTLLRFVWLGMQHIATGYDHLAFLLGLLIATASLRSLVKTITSFTIAHSITLALATFDVVILPSRFTESMIALSIIYVAVENLIRKRSLERWRITFLFGLIHGFGFSNVLREMQLPRPDLALSLFSFNAGVEIGQLIFVILLFPALEDLMQRGWRWLRPAISWTIALLAAYWFIQRAIFA